MLIVALLLILIYFLTGFILAYREKVAGYNPLHEDSPDTGIVDPSIYDSDYYLKAFKGDPGQYIDELNNRMQNSLDRSMELGDPKPSERVLDIGCGRGQLAYTCAVLGCITTAIDYSEDAVKLTMLARENLPVQARGRLEVSRMDFKDLDENKAYDVIFMADLIEHLTDEQIGQLMKKISRILVKGTGRAVIHTTPNRLFINLVYPLKRILNWPQILKNKKSFFYQRGKYSYDLSMHINEQTPLSLKKHLKGFNTRVWCEDGSANVISLLTKSFAGSDIWAVVKVSL
jgi:2-polyprenyl-3-methyl-5-hydroxy-6-metoxy-1,4-benzoquinol methylase